MDKNFLDVYDPEEVVDAMGIPSKRRSGRTYILCPAHEERLGRPDRSFGNCVLTEYGCHCFACGASMNTKNIVKAFLKCSDEEARRYIAETAGFEYSENDNSVTNTGFHISAADASVIGLSESLYDTVTDENGNTQKAGLNALYDTDRERYYRLIHDNAAVMLDRYQKCRENYCSMQAPEAYYLYDLLGDTFDNGIYKKLDRELDGRIKTCKKMIEISERYLR